MKRCADRILTTHVGSLCRPHDVLEDILTKLENYASAVGQENVIASRTAASPRAGA